MYTFLALYILIGALLSLSSVKNLTFLELIFVIIAWPVVLVKAFLELTKGD